MRNVSNRFSTMLGAGLFLLFGVVFAQVLPEESLTEQSPSEYIEETEILDVPPEVVEQPVASTSEMMIEESSTTSPEMITDEAETGSTTSTTNIVEENTATTTLSTDEAVTEIMLPFELTDISSKRDIEKPSQCQNENARELFDSIGECVRFVLENASEERPERPEADREPGAANELLE